MERKRIWMDFTRRKKKKRRGVSEDGKTKESETRKTKTLRHFAGRRIHKKYPESSFFCKLIKNYYKTIERCINGFIYQA